MKNEKYRLDIQGLALCRAFKVIFIGIDPGVTTGFCVWDANKRHLYAPRSGSIFEAMDFVKEYIRLSETKVVLVVEDARLRKKFNRGAEGYQGAGSVKRDSKMWQEFCEKEGIDYYLKSPVGALNSFDSSRFSQYTNTNYRTNEHGRSAAMLVFGL